MPEEVSGMEKGEISSLELDLLVDPKMHKEGDHKKSSLSNGGRATNDIE